MGDCPENGVDHALFAGGETSPGLFTVFFVGTPPPPPPVGFFVRAAIEDQCVKIIGRIVDVVVSLLGLAFQSRGERMPRRVENDVERPFFGVDQFGDGRMEYRELIGLVRILRAPVGEGTVPVEVGDPAVDRLGPVEFRRPGLRVKGTERGQNQKEEQGKKKCVFAHETNPFGR